MADNSSSHVNIPKLILVPSIITLAVTLLRLVGELQNWPSVLFNREAGGGGSIIGITWLALIFGAYFAVKIARSGEEAPGAWRVIGFALLGLVITIAGLFLVGMKAEFPGKIIIGLVLIAAGGVMPFLGWRTLAKVLLAYGYAARIPVLIVMYFAFRGNWHTHYDAVPPEFSELPFWSKFLQMAVVPQMMMWIVFTLTVGSIFGAIAIAFARRGKTASQHQPA